MNIVFFGTPDFAAYQLVALAQSNHNVLAVVTAPDKPVGRSLQLTPPQVKISATAHGIPVLQPEKLSDTAFVAQLQALGADVFVVVAFRKLPTAVYQIPKLGTFNLHTSLLPQYRGAAPIHWAVINGETKTGLTTFLIDEQIDTGAMLMQAETPIAENETTGAVYDRLMKMGPEILLNTLNMLSEGNAKPLPQPKAAELKPAPKLNADNTVIDWTANAESVRNLIRGLNPFPGAYSYLLQGDERLHVKVHLAERTFQSSHGHQAGSIQVFNKTQLWVACGDEWLSITEIQPATKKKMTAAAFINGRKDLELAKFEV